MKTYNCEECCDTGYVRDFCDLCRGSGEGYYDGSKCLGCKGSGMAYYKCDCGQKNISTEDWDNVNHYAKPDFREEDYKADYIDYEEED